MRVLVAQRKGRFIHLLKYALNVQRFCVDEATDGEAALELACTTDYDVIILDLLLPKLDGLSLVRRLRAQRVTAPILIVTSSSSARERIAALVAGADDYVTRPATLDEIVVHLRVLLRRPRTFADVLRVADLELDRARHRVVRNGILITLTPREYSLLEYLMCNAGAPLSRSQLVDHVWHSPFDHLTNIVDVYINYLRAKIDRGFSSKLIQTVYGYGYVLMASATPAVSHSTPFLVDSKRLTNVRTRALTA